jgi:hypothetical protein
MYTEVLFIYIIMMPEKNLGIIIIRRFRREILIGEGFLLSGNTFFHHEGHEEHEGMVRSLSRCFKL